MPRVRNTGTAMTSATANVTIPAPMQASQGDTAYSLLAYADR